MRKKFYQKRPRKRSVDFVNLGVILVVLAVVGISFYQYFAKADTPSPSSYSLDSCVLVIGSGKNLPNSSGTNDPDTIKNVFTINGNVESVTYGSPESVSGVGKLYRATSTTMSVSTPVTTYYLYAATKTSSYSAGQGSSNLITSTETEVYFKNSSTGKFEVSNPGKSNNLAAYISWINTSPSCVASASDTNSDTYVSYGNSTVKINQTSANGSTADSWYYVAYGNYTPTAGSLISVSGYIYVNSSKTKYLLVKDNGDVDKMFTIGSVPNDWKEITPNSIMNWKAPERPKNQLQLKSLSVDVSSALGTLSSTYASNNSAPGQEPTFEILLGGNNGPDITKNQGNFDSTFTHLVDDDVAGPAYVVSSEDLESLYSLSSDKEDHKSKLITQITICAHKSLTTDNSGAPYLSNGKTIDVLDGASKNYGGSEITNTSESNASTVAWSEKSSPLTWSVTSQTNTQTCGTAEDKSTATGVGENAATSVGNPILEAITNALKGLASIIQKAIIQFVALIIVWVTGYVPI